MCEGKRPADSRLAAALARLPEALAELERAQARARAAEMQRRVEETYGRRRRLKRVADAIEAAGGRIHETRASLRVHEQRLSAPSDPSASSC